MMLRFIIAFILMALLASPVFASEATEAFVREVATELTEGELSTEEFTKAVDVSGIANFTLGKHARRVDAAERERYTAAIEGFLIEQFREHSVRFNGGEIKVVGSKDRSEDDSIVETEVTTKDGERMDVNWRVIRRGGDWRVVDIQVNDLWLAIEQRAQIVAILGEPRSDIDDAIQSLKG